MIEAQNVAFDSVSDIIFTGNQDNGTTRQNALGNVTWATIGGGDGGDVVVAENEPVGAGCTGTAPCSTRILSSQFLV